MKPRVLIVDDEETIRKLLNSRLTRENYDVVVASNAEEAEVEFKKGVPISTMITDIRMPGRDGFDLMKWAKQYNPLLRVIMITGHGEKELAIQALRSGATDYLEKPFDLDELTHTVARSIREVQLESENSDLVDRLEARIERIEGKPEDQYWFVSQSSAMEKVNEWLSVLRRESMRGDAEEPTVTITGESGTGKEGIARMIHAGSRRGKGPWVAVNCANFNEQLLESELFGHEKGAFTGANTLKRGLFEISKGGTLFLDELGEMDIKLQARLLRVLQEKVFRRVGGTVDLEADVRVVTATHQNLKKMVSEGKFREDLYHRISRVVIEVPPLRERKGDAVEMARQFFERAFRQRGKTFSGFTPDAENAIREYAWPGNVRELLNLVERTALIWQGNGVVPESSLNLPKASRPSQVESLTSSPASPYEFQGNQGIDGYMALKKKWSDAFEREYLINALQRHHGNVSAAAREAKIDRSNFLRLLRRHEIKAQEFRKVA
ncbi:MAG: hypothetical protein CL678_17325 [Bdellovibrionaceae bacterium]|nr:hypothetical protein [Pseudobdellovibrionaceae bacterium]|tara:strand:- start:2367 stop:3848 length:1482 start_codon:yes stop_codon:yes gene_type:complete